MLYTPQCLDQLFIRQLALECIIGVYDWERLQPQRLWLDIEVGLDLSTACSDNLADTLDYAALAQQITQWCQGSRFELIESLALYLIEQLFAQHRQCQTLTLTLTKPQALPGEAVPGIRLHRRRSENDAQASGVTVKTVERSRQSFWGVSED